MTSVLAIDLGGSSGRAVIGKVTPDGQLKLQEVNRFGDYLIHNETKITWDMPRIMEEIHKSLSLADSLASDFVSLGVDTWGVDFGLLEAGRLIANPRAYRDPYTRGQLEYVANLISIPRLYELTGIQALEMNTLFQLVAYQKRGQLTEGQQVLLMPDLINYLLTGFIGAEQTIASTTQLLDVRTKTWSQELLTKLNLERLNFPDIVQPGTVIGELDEPTRKRCGVSAKKVIAVGSHDTASAVFSLPDVSNAYFLSSGTWSLLGVQTEEPYINQASKKYQISHEQGVADSYLLLKNITGLWLIEEAKRDLATRGLTFSYAEISQQVRASQSLAYYFDTELSALALPGNFAQKITEFGVQTKQQAPTTPGELFKTVYENLALKYRSAFDELEETIGASRELLYIVGGGSNAEILCQYTANVLNKVVYAGMSEATVVGNVLSQLVALNEITIAEKAVLVENSFEFKQYLPQDVEHWEAKYNDYKKKVEAVSK